MRRVARQENRLTLQADKQRMIRDILKPIRVVTRRLKQQAASLNLNYEY
jgi:hypothetical protein